MQHAVAPLSSADIGVLTRVQALLGEGRTADANNAILGVSPAAASHPDTLFVAASLLEAQGRPADAKRALEGALQQAGGHWQLWNGYAGLLARLGDHDAAIGAYRNGLKHSPANGELLRNLTLTQLEAGRPDEAQRSLDEAETAEPDTIAALRIAAAIAEARGDKPAAARRYRTILSRVPADVSATVNLAGALRSNERAAEALELLGGIAEDAVTLTIRAHCLNDLGWPREAAEAYRAAIAANPAYLEPHEALARLLPQLGERDAALASYDTAMAQFPGSRMLHESAILAARDVKDAKRMQHWAEQAIERFGPDPMFRVSHGVALGLAGDRSAAIDVLRAVVEDDPASLAARNHLAPLLLADGDLAKAEEHALAGTRIDPDDQSGWAWLSVIWRLKGDAREHWLADYDRFVLPVRLSLPEGIVPMLNGLHTTGFHPAEQSLRGGTQTHGNLLDRRAPAIAQLRDTIADAVRRAIAMLPGDPDHPFLKRRTNDFAFTGSWSVRLRGEGFHISHIHHKGWLSSACYIALPPVGGPDRAGCLEFGVPDATLGLDLGPRRTVTPEEGMLVLFPSYFWHGTVPFISETPRLTVAFDAIPI